MRRPFTSYFTAVVALALLASTPVAASDSSEAANKALVREYYDVVLDGGDFDAIGQFVDSDEANLDPEHVRKLEGYRREHVPDLHYVIEEMVAEDDTVVVRLREIGTHTGSAPGLPATGAEIDLPAVAIYRVEDGKIRSLWYLDDKLKLAKAVGMRISHPGSGAGGVDGIGKPGS